MIQKRLHVLCVVLLRQCSCICSCLTCGSKVVFGAWRRWWDIWMKKAEDADGKCGWRIWHRFVKKPEDRDFAGGL